MWERNKGANRGGYFMLKCFSLSWACTTYTVDYTMKPLTIGNQITGGSTACMVLSYKPVKFGGSDSLINEW